MKKKLKLSRSTRISLLVTAGLVFALMYLLINQTFSEKPQPSHLVNCDIQKASCTQNMAGSTITLDIQPKPVRTMETQTFKVKVEGMDVAKKPHIDLGMPSMDMGLNWVFLTQLNQREYEGKGTFVKCPEGRTICQATVTLPEKGSVHFVFEVPD